MCVQETTESSAAWTDRRDNQGQSSVVTAPTVLLVLALYFTLPDLHVCMKGRGGGG